MCGCRQRYAFLLLDVLYYSSHWDILAHVLGMKRPIFKYKITKFNTLIYGQLYHICVDGVGTDFNISLPR